MNALRALMQHHDRVEGVLVDMTQRAEQDPQARQREISEYASLLRRHMDVEEAQFYQLIAERLILVSAAPFIEQHRQIRAALHELEADVETPEFPDRLERLHELVVQHVSDEEIELFPEVKRRFSVDELDDMGERIERSMEEEEQVSPPTVGSGHQP
jgi:hemerythrin-like domain-containing protein